MRENAYRAAFVMLVAFALLICARNLFAQELRVMPHQCLAPCEVRVELRITADKTNRWWSISYSGPEDGSSGGSLDDMSEAIQPVCTTNLRPCFRTLRADGTYLFVGCVHRTVSGKLKPVCTQQEVYVAEDTWTLSTPATSAKARFSRISTRARRSAGSKVPP